MKDVRRHHVLHGLGFVAFLAVLEVTIPNPPLHDDTRFYTPAAQAYGDWFADAVSGLLRGEATLWSREALDRTFRLNHEHPPIAKYLMASGYLLFHRTLGWADAVNSCRIPIVLLFWMTCGLLWWTTYRRTKRITAAWCAAGFFVTLPRLFFHGHVATLDFAVSAFLFATTVCWFEHREAEIRSKRWALWGIASVLAYAAALGSKLNAPFALLAFLVVLFVLDPPRLTKKGWQLPHIPWAMVGMLIVAPLLVAVLWPWLWFDTAARLAAYVEFHAQHYGILFYFLGRTYEHGVAPWFAPTTMLLTTTPVFLLVTGGGGGWLVVRQLLRDRLGLNDRDQTSARLRLMLCCIAVIVLQLMAVSLPGIPKYGGVKLFLPVLPHLCLLAGLTWPWFADSIPSRRLQQVALASALALATITLLESRHTLLSYYAPWLGGVRGAHALGLERQYYDLAYPEIPKSLSDELPESGRFTVLPNPKEYRHYLDSWRRRGLLRADINYEERPRLQVRAQPLYVVLTHEHRWPGYRSLRDLLSAYPIRAERRIRGIPLWTVFKLPATSTR